MTQVQVNSLHYRVHNVSTLPFQPILHNAAGRVFTNSCCLTGVCFLSAIHYELESCIYFSHNSYHHNAAGSVNANTLDCSILSNYAHHQVESEVNIVHCSYSLDTYNMSGRVCNTQIY